MSFRLRFLSTGATAVPLMIVMALPGLAQAQSRLDGEQKVLRPSALNFEPNRGQAPEGVQYLVNRGNQRLQFLADHAVLEVISEEGPRRRGALTSESLKSRKILRARVEMRFRGSRRVTTPQALDSLPGKVNYLLGNDPSKWITEVPTYARLLYRDVYPDVDLIYYGSDGSLEYDFIARPGADTSQIDVEFSGAEKMGLTAEGDLLLDTAAGQMRWKKPYVYQDDFGVRKKVEGQYRLKQDGHVGFELGKHDPTLPVVIDPVLEYSSYFGGSNVDSASVRTDATGVYLAGTTYSSNLPVTPGAMDTTLSGDYDVFVSKLNPAGNSLIFTTYLGGFGREGLNGARMGQDGSIYVCGFTTSSDFPTSFGAFDRTYNGGSDAFVTRLNPSGSGVLWSTYLGSSGEDNAFDMVLDSAGAVYLTGSTTSGGFPVTSGAYRVSYSGGETDAYAAKLSSTGSSLIYATLLGGNGAEVLENNNLGPEPPNLSFVYANSIAVDSLGNAYIAGVTSSTNFPTTAGALSRTYSGGGADCYLTKLNPTGSAVVFSTYCGGSGFDAVANVRVDTSGNASIAGITYSSNLPTTADGYDRTYGGAGDGYLMRFNSSGSALLYSTYFGGTGEESWTAVHENANGTVLLSAITYSTDMPVTTGAYQPANAGGGDTYFAAFTPSGTLLDSTYFGGSGLEIGGAAFGVDPNEVWLSGRTNSTNLPTTAGAYSRQRNGTEFDVFFARFRLTPGNCSYALPVSTATFAATGGTGSITVTANCAWTASSDSPWATITSGGSGAANGVVGYTVAANPSAQSRTATITIAGQTFTIQQSGVSVCNYTLSTTSISLGSSSATITVTVTAAAGCAWSAATNALFVNITSGATGVGNGTVTINVSANTGSVRVGTVTVAGQTYTITQAAGNSGGGGGSFNTALAFFPVQPCRVADTRNAAGPFGGPTMSGGSTRTFNVSQSACGIPATAQAYSVNVTVVPSGALSYLTIWPAGQSQPLVSTLNSFQGFIVANAAIVPAGSSGGINVFVTDRTDVIIDINGYFAPLTQAGGLYFYPASPCRVADTRNAAGPFGGPVLQGGQTRSFPVPGSPCGIPAEAKAYSMNFTVVPSGPLSYLTTWPTGQPQPLVSTLNSFQGFVVANAGLVPAGTGGAINLFATDQTQSILDINGYFAP